LENRYYHIKRKENENKPSVARNLVDYEKRKPENFFGKSISELLSIKSKGKLET